MFINHFMFTFTVQGFIDHHTAALLRIIAGLMAWAGMVEGGPVERIAWSKYQAILRILRPAESAVRRLIVVAAARLPIKLRTKPPARKPKTRPKRSAGPENAEVGKGARTGRYIFSLFDPPRRNSDESEPNDGPKSGHGSRQSGNGGPRVWSVDAFLADAEARFRGRPDALRGGPAADGTVAAKRLCRRLQAMVQALEDLPRQAKRYAAWRNIPVEERPPHRVNAVRPGRPPWLPRKSTHEVHEILRECQFMMMCPPPRDTS